MVLVKTKEQLIVKIRLTQLLGSAQHIWQRSTQDQQDVLDGFVAVASFGIVEPADEDTTECLCIIFA